MPDVKRRPAPKPRPTGDWFDDDHYECSREDFADWHPPTGGRFRGRGVVVTGGASGIGRAIAIGFALEGARVTVLDINAKKGRETATLLRRLSPGSQFLRLDLENLAAVEKAGRLFAGAHGAEILVNNAVMLTRIAPVHELAWKDCERSLRVNLAAPFLLAQRAAAGLIAATRTGVILNILTVQTALPVRGYAPYVASKGGLEALTLALATDLAPHGIRVNGVQVGSVYTGSYYKVLPASLQREIDHHGVQAVDRRAATLLGRMGRAVEIARVVTFLASSEASYLTGSLVRADGGRAISRKVEIQG